MKRFLSIAAALIVVSASLSAKVKLPSIISDNMVLQQKTLVTLWGWSEPKATVTVTPSWSSIPVTVKADKDGKWTAQIRTTMAGGPYDITFDDGDEVVVSDVLLGEVWFCSGQSNMVMPMNGFSAQPVEDALDYIVKAKASRPIRVCNIKRKTSVKPLENAKCAWWKHTPENVARSSATAYFFAEYLNSVLDVPVGVITSAWGGAKVWAWMDRTTLEGFEGVPFPAETETEFKSPQHIPTLLFNGMVAPFTSYTIKGMLWYQGCSDRDNPAMYAELMPAYVKMMRNYWGQGEIPFYFVQIAPYKYDGPEKFSGAYIREVQLNSLKTIPNSGMVTTHDLGDENCIHPAKKREVGRRLALHALSNDYGMEGFDPNPPMFESMTVKGNTVEVLFSTGEVHGLARRGWELAGFEVAGEDKVFYPASAKIGGKGDRTVIVTSDKVQNPVAVRYGFHNSGDEASVFSSMGIPASPFRTDNW